MNIYTILAISALAPSIWCLWQAIGDWRADGMTALLRRTVQFAVVHDILLVLALAGHVYHSYEAYAPLDVLICLALFAMGLNAVAWRIYVVPDIRYPKG